MVIDYPIEEESDGLCQVLRTQLRKISVNRVRNIDIYLSVFLLMVFIIINGCDNAYDEVINEGKFAGIKIGQSKREVLKSLGLHEVTEIIPYYTNRVRIGFNNINKIQELQSERGICLGDSKGLSLDLEFDESNDLIEMKSSAPMKRIEHRIKVGQSKSEVLRYLNKLVMENRKIIIRDCVNLFWVNPQEIKEEEIQYMSKHDMWRYHATDSYSYPDLHFSDSSLSKIVYHYRPTEFSFLD